MAENTVVIKEQLTDAMIEAGAELTRKLDEIGLVLSAAFWLFDSEINEWRLVYATPEVDQRGPIWTYGQIQQALKELGAKASATPFLIIKLLPPNADLVKQLRATVPTGPGISRIRFSKNVANGHYVEDALIYRVQ